MSEMEKFEKAFEVARSLARDSPSRHYKIRGIPYFLFIPVYQQWDAQCQDWICYKYLRPFIDDLEDSLRGTATTANGFEHEIGVRIEYFTYSEFAQIGEAQY